MVRRGKRLSKRLDDVIKVIMIQTNGMPILALGIEWMMWMKRLTELEGRVRGLSYLVKKNSNEQRIEG